MLLDLQQMASFTITVTDNEAPTIDNLPANIAVNNDAGVCGADVTWVEPTSADNCAGSTIAQTAGLVQWRYIPCRSHNNYLHSY